MSIASQWLVLLLCHIVDHRDLIEHRVLLIERQGRGGNRRPHANRKSLIEQAKHRVTPIFVMALATSEQFLLEQA